MWHLDWRAKQEKIILVRKIFNWSEFRIKFIARFLNRDFLLHSLPNNQRHNSTQLSALTTSIVHNTKIVNLRLILMNVCYVKRLNRHRVRVQSRNETRKSVFTWINLNILELNQYSRRDFSNCRSSTALQCKKCCQIPLNSLSSNWINKCLVLCFLHSFAKRFPSDLYCICFKQNVPSLWSNWQHYKVIEALLNLTSPVHQFFGATFVIHMIASRDGFFLKQSIEIFTQSKRYTNPNFRGPGVLVEMKNVDQSLTREPTHASRDVTRARAVYLFALRRRLACLSKWKMLIKVSLRYNWSDRAFITFFGR